MFEPVVMASFLEQTGLTGLRDRYDRSVLTVRMASFRKLGIYTTWPSLLRAAGSLVYLNFLNLFP